MLAWLKKAIAWICIAALPVQGWAAAAMLNCGPSHHRSANAFEAALHAFHSHPEDVAEAPSLAHDEDASVGDATQATADAHGSAHGDLATLSKFKCSACAACCSPAGLPTAAFALDVPVSVHFAAPVPFTRDVLFLTCGTDRPPRANLA
jgi:hypothetical protein